MQKTNADMLGNDPAKLTLLRSFCSEPDNKVQKKKLKENPLLIHLLANFNKSNKV